jgi:hypothetical protein
MRLNFEFPDERVKELKELQGALGVDMKTLVNTALTVFEWCVEETKQGNEIAAVSEDEHIYRVLITPPLQAVAKKYKKVAAAAAAQAV